MRVSHCGNNHLLCLSNERVALLVLGDGQTSLLKTAQQSASSSSHPRTITKTLG